MIKQNYAIYCLIIVFMLSGIGYSFAQAPKATISGISQEQLAKILADAAAKKLKDANTPKAVEPEKKYLSGLTEAQYNKFFEGSFLFSSVERALIQKAINGKVDEPRKNLIQEQKQKELLAPINFNVERRAEAGYGPIPASIPGSPEAQKPTAAAVTNAVIAKALPAPIAKNLSIKQEEIKVAKPIIPEQRLITLSGVIYRGENDWVVWINGEKVTPDNYLPEIIEINVENSSYVKLKWYDIGLQEVISITLRPNQTYDITTGILLPG